MAALVAVLLGGVLPATANADELLDTRITSSPANLHRSSEAIFNFQGRAGEDEWTGCAYDPEVDDYVCPVDFECSLDGSAWARCTPVLTLHGLADGYHVFSVRGVKGPGTDPTPATRVFRVRETGAECYQALQDLDQAEYYLEDVLRGLAIQVQKLREWKQEVRTATGRDRERARERLKQQREQYSKTRRHLREARIGLRAAQAHRDAACGG